MVGWKLLNININQLGITTHHLHVFRHTVFVHITKTTDHTNKNASPSTIHILRPHVTHWISFVCHLSSDFPSTMPVFNRCPSVRYLYVQVRTTSSSSAVSGWTLWERYYSWLQMHCDSSKTFRAIDNCRSFVTSCLSWQKSGIRDA